jgi:hypothetical protein
MSVTEATIHSATPSGAMPELVAGLAVIVLTILGLAGVAPNFLVAIATIVFGVGLLLFGASEVATLNRCLSQRAAGNAVVGLALNGWSTIFLVGLGGIVLGILALLGVATTTACGDCGHRIWRGIASEQSRRDARKASRSAYAASGRGSKASGRRHGG